MAAYAMQGLGPTACGRSLQAEKVDGQDAECVIACMRQEARRGVDVAAEESEAYGEHEDVAEQQRWTVLDVHRGEEDGRHRYPENRLHGTPEERLLPETGADPDQQCEEHSRDRAQALRIEECLGEFTDLTVKVGLQLCEQGVGGHREPERPHYKQYDYTQLREGDGTIAETGERLARVASDAGADAKNCDEDERELAGEDGNRWDPTSGPEGESVDLSQLLEPDYSYQVVGEHHRGEQPEGEKDRRVRRHVSVLLAANDLHQRGGADRQSDQDH